MVSTFTRPCISMYYLNDIVEVVEHDGGVPGKQFCRTSARLDSDFK